ncbi:co-chaperone GroES [Paratissierella segnis]|jgi:chaperonin GroES|uniref:Co-chaperonin GroES n=1 Tax=Paratissierella segnis TaxID=2763679 RepID=A0A926EZF3_9FIRM|nr:co-chaperone GroES [Paratissierella segnis]MBC8589119.1 co-chaperone GroES [Paratissierella segnis]
MNLKPLGDRLVIKKVEVEEKTKSGIVLPSTAKEQPSMAEVLAIGSEITDDEKKKDTIKVGDKVIFSKYAGTEIKVDNEELTILKLSDILAVVE